MVFSASEVSDSSHTAAAMPAMVSIARRREHALYLSSSIGGLIWPKFVTRGRKSRALNFIPPVVQGTPVDKLPGPLRIDATTPFDGPSVSGSEISLILGTRIATPFFGTGFNFCVGACS